MKNEINGTLNTKTQPSTYVILAALVMMSFSQAASALPGAKPSLEEAIQIYRQRQDDIQPAEVLSFLKEGNARFAEGRSIHGGYVSDARERIAVSAAGQRPIAAVLSCIDSRTAPEMVFDTTVGDLFTARVGANVVNDDVIGSLEIAADSGAKVLLVLGHSDCGGIKAACNNVEYGHFTQLLERIKPAIALAHSFLDSDPVLNHQIGERLTSNRKYVAHVSHVNARESARILLEKSFILREKIASGEIIFMPALYNVDNGRVTFQ